LLIFWLIWCVFGLLFDVVYVLWWFWEMVMGDPIGALTNILISMITMGKFDLQAYTFTAKFHFIYSY